MQTVSDIAMLKDQIIDLANRYSRLAHRVEALESLFEATPDDVEALIEERLNPNIRLLARMRDDPGDYDVQDAAGAMLHDLTHLRAALRKGRHGKANEAAIAKAEGKAITA